MKKITSQLHNSTIKKHTMKFTANTITWK